MQHRIGLLHFNIDYVKGSVGARERYCEEVVAGVVNLLDSKQRWRTTLSFSGSCLHYIAGHYPSLMDSILRLSRENRIEVLASTFTHSLWPAFPLIDLLQSVKLARCVLADLGLPESRTFFAQEAFFGSGLEQLYGRFDALVCKDDYLSHFEPALQGLEAFSLGLMPCLVAKGHLRQGRISSPDGISRTEGQHHLRQETYQRLRWYHCGSAHHIVTERSPYDTNRFFYDYAWVEKMAESMELDSDHSVFGTISEALTIATDNPLTPLSYAVEGSWNSRKSGGVARWIQHQSSKTQDQSGLLGRVWTARGRLLTAIECLTRQGNASSTEATRLFEAGWMGLLQAEGSDGFGWSPAECEREATALFADSVLRVASDMEILASQEDSCLRKTSTKVVRSRNRKLTTIPFASEGGVFQITIWNDTSGRTIYDIVFRAEASVCGVSFPAPNLTVVYSPSCREHTTVTLDMKDRQMDTICLPLTNGLFSLEKGCYWVRDNSFGFIGGVLNKQLRTWSFFVEGAGIGKTFSLRLWQLAEDEQDALDFANGLNKCL